MACTRPGETDEQARWLDLLDVAFLRWYGLSRAQALLRVGISEGSLRRWTADPDNFLGGRPAPVRYLIDTSQVEALD